MRNRFDRQLKQLNDELIEMGSLIERSIEMAVSALVTQDVERAAQVVSFDEEIDHQEQEIESLCMKLLLQQQPVATDLRTISSALKMITDMERIGDQSADISELTIMMADAPYIKKLTHISRMAKEITLMVMDSVEAFVKKDLELAKSVIAHDDVVDQLFVEIKGELIRLISENPENGDQAMDLMMVAKYFERIGDHATNIAEWVIYAITGTHVWEVQQPSVQQASNGGTDVTPTAEEGQNERR